MRRSMHDGQKARPLHENGTSRFDGSCTVYDRRDQSGASVCSREQFSTAFVNQEMMT